MVTAVGLDAPSACAAMRARLDGFQETRFLGPGGDWLVGAPVPLPRNWIGEKRLAHLAAAAIFEAFDAGARGPRLRRADPLPRRGGPPRPPRRPTRARLAARIAEIVGSTPAHAHPHRRPRPPLRPCRARAGPPPSRRRARVPMCDLRGRQLPDGADDRALPRRAPPPHPRQPQRLHPRRGGAAVLCTRPGAGGVLRLLGLGLAREASATSTIQTTCRCAATA